MVEINKYIYLLEIMKDDLDQLCKSDDAKTLSSESNYNIIQSTYKIDEVIQHLKKVAR